jgi:hypothetical protein
MKTEKDYWTLLDQLDEIEVKKGIRLIDHSIDLENASDAELSEDDAGYWDYMYGSAKYWADVRAELYGVKL